jgi:transposase-like protein
MVTIILHYPHCGSEARVARWPCHGRQTEEKYRCHACGCRSRENPASNAYFSIDII